MPIELARQFHISDVLSVTTRRLFSQRGMDGVYDICEFVTGNPDISTIGLEQTSKFARLEVLDQHPQLASVTLPEFSEDDNQETRKIIISGWLEKQSRVFGETLTIKPADNPPILSVETDIAHALSINPNLNPQLQQMNSCKELWYNKRLFDTNKIIFDFGYLNKCEFKKIKIEGTHPNIDLVIPVSA